MNKEVKESINRIQEIVDFYKLNDENNYDYSDEVLISMRILLNYTNKQKEVLNKIKNNNKRIIDYGFDYDGFNKEEDLKKLIDMLVDYAKQNDKLLEKINE